MTFRHVTSSLLMLILVCGGLSLASNASAESVKLAEEVVYQYGGPETRTRCLASLKTKGVPSCRTVWNRWYPEVYCTDNWIETCTQWATDIQQHAYYITMYGTKDMDPGQVARIKNSCLASAIASQLGGINFAVDSAAQLLTSRRPIMEGIFITCLKTTQGLGRLVVSEFRLDTERRDFWP